MFILITYLNLIIEFTNHLSKNKSKMNQKKFANNNLELNKNINKKRI